jgi:hypothetical protein
MPDRNIYQTLAEPSFNGTVSLSCPLRPESGHEAWSFVRFGALQIVRDL